MASVASVAVFVLALISVQAGLPPLAPPSPPLAPPHQGSVASTLSQGVLDDRANFFQQWHEIVTLLRQKPSLWEDDDVDPAPESFLEPLEDNVYVPFTCPPLPPSSTVPKSVHALRPGDIKIIGALGDSITAGMGVRAKPDKVWTTFIPNQGESYSVGGERSLEEGSLTLTNILRKYNPDLEGASYCARVRQHKYTGFNVAIPGDTNRGMESQARDLINRLVANGIDQFYDSWKLITLFIGGNDLCQNCIPLRGDAFTAENYMLGIKAALDLMHKHLPRTFVNVLIINDVGVVQNLTHPGREDQCDTLHGIECACAMNQTRQFLKNLQMDYYHKVNELISSGVYDTRDDFTVVYQPFLRDQDPIRLPNGKYDMSFIAPDCFHPNHKSHQAFALLLWNSMFIPVGEKPFETESDDFPPFHCPTEDKPYFCTSKNCK